MSIINIPFTFSAGAVIVASQHNTNFSTIYSDYNGGITNANIDPSAAITYSKLSLTGGIVNADVNASAAIVDSKLATISTAGKVNISALTVASQAQGDVIYASSGSAWARLGPGTSGQFLRTQGAAANPVWGSAAMTFVSNTSVSTAATTGNIAIANTNYYKVWFKLTTFSADDTLVFQFNADGTGDDYSYVFNGRTTGGAITGGDDANTGINLSTAINSGGDLFTTGQISIYPSNGSENQIDGVINYSDSAGGLYTSVDFSGRYSGGSPTSFRIITLGGATFSGNVITYSMGQS